METELFSSSHSLDHCYLTSPFNVIVTRHINRPVERQWCRGWARCRWDGCEKSEINQNLWLIQLWSDVESLIWPENIDDRALEWRQLADWWLKYFNLENSTLSSYKTKTLASFSVQFRYQTFYSSMINWTRHTRQQHSFSSRNTSNRQIITKINPSGQSTQPKHPPINSPTPTITPHRAASPLHRSESVTELKVKPNNRKRGINGERARECHSLDENCFGPRHQRFINLIGFLEDGRETREQHKHFTGGDMTIKFNYVTRHNNFSKHFFFPELRATFRSLRVSPILSVSLPSSLLSFAFPLHHFIDFSWFHFRGGKKAFLLRARLPMSLLLRMEGRV